MNSKIGFSKVKALVNSTTQQREQQRYQLPSIGNQPLERYGDLMATTFSANLAHSTCGLLI